MLKYFLVLSHTYSHISWSATKSTIRWSRPQSTPCTGLVSRIS